MKYLYKKTKSLEELTDWLNELGNVQIVLKNSSTGEVIVRVMEPYIIPQQSDSPSSSTVGPYSLSYGGVGLRKQL